VPADRDGVRLPYSAATDVGEVGGLSNLRTFSQERNVPTTPHAEYTPS
jgi:hypothetical protein